MNTPNPCLQKVVATPLGDLRLLASPQGLAGTWFVHDQRHGPSAERLASWPTVEQHPVLDDAARQIAAYFQGKRPRFAIPLDLAQGTAFQQDVWRALLEIPAGQTTSYGALARHIGRPNAVRAVGAAVGRNPLSIVVPCHRVLGANGALTGYAGGLERKRALLLLESGDL
ncbi:methylated-DNA--[protein]-cysteine S-methyltransferase [Hydrogenophaga sp. MI9]|uniref:methylated-DNA--[protein]-cysteine S-methyltransferase n=1 Tax=Hydrogenophaga sp. MI9 TaxID=3453719 RepID=UPI003EEB9C3A